MVFDYIINYVYFGFFEKNLLICAGDFFMVDVVNMGLMLRILPDDDMVRVIEQNIGNSRFIWNNLWNVH